MKIQKTMAGNSAQQEKNTHQQQMIYTPSFKAGGFSGLLNIFGGTMQGIENGGFLASFLIQDMLGMTAPRVGAAFLRDKDVTGEYNIQEGFEVLGREGLTGPCMMAVAPISFALAAKFGRSTGVNSQLIKRFGNSLKEFITRPNFDKTLLKNKEAFKREFYTKNIKEMLNNTVGRENVTEESIKYILEQIAKYEKIPSNAVLPKNLIGIKSKSKYRDQLLSEISNHVNSIKYQTANDLQMLDKLKLGNGNDLKAFSTKNAIEGMIKYSDDIVGLNKNFEKLDEAMAEDLKNSSIAKRFIANISTIAATLGVLSILPKLYMRSSVSPGARTAMQLKEAREQETSKNNSEEVKEISFKGAKPPKSSWLSKLGKKLSKIFDKDFVANELLLEDLKPITEHKSTITVKKI